MRAFVRRAKASRSPSLRGDDDGSGLILVFLVMLISSALSLVLLEGAVSMAKQTRPTTSGVTSLSAAQAGLDAGLGQIRNAVNPVTGSGDLTQIPCTVAGGNVGGNGSPTQGTHGGSYTIQVAYYSVDPTAQTAGVAGQLGQPDQLPGRRPPGQGARLRAARRHRAPPAPARRPRSDADHVHLHHDQPEHRRRPDPPRTTTASRHSPTCARTPAAPTRTVGDRGDHAALRRRTTRASSGPTRAT